MKQQDREDRHRPPANGQGWPVLPETSVTVVGGLPWAGTAAAPRPPGGPAGVDEPLVPRLTIRTDAAGGSGHDAGRGVVRPSGRGGAGAVFGPLAAGGGDWLLRHSPAWTTSLSIHCLILLLLALWVVRERHAEKLRLTLGFVGPASTAEEPGAEIMVAPPMEQRQEERTEIARADLPPVESPQATAAVMPDDTPGQAVASEVVAPAVGMLLSGREVGRREALVRAGGGTGETEAAVALALKWLASRQDSKDGLWSLKGRYLDGGAQENRLAATAMALLALQGAGNTPNDGPHRASVARGWKSLLARQQPDGTFDAGDLPLLQGLYSHAQATIALCELYGMTRDEKLAAPAARAVSFALAAQGGNGGWKYEPGQNGDMSVTGWYMMALKSAQMAGIDVPPDVFTRISGFVDSVSNEKGTRYGYMRHSPLKPASPVTAAVTAEALLCRQYLGWPRRDPRLVEGVELLLGDTMLDFENGKDVYTWYYITQVAHHMGGEPWRRWNDRLREVLPREQVKTGSERGSWDPSLDRWGHVGGRLFMTSFCACMLEVYYRHLPLYADHPAESP